MNSWALVTWVTEGCDSSHRLGLEVRHNWRVAQRAWAAAPLSRSDPRVPTLLSEDGKMRKLILWSVMAGVLSVFALGGYGGAAYHTSPPSLERNALLR